MTLDKIYSFKTSNKDKQRTKSKVVEQSLKSMLCLFQQSNSIRNITDLMINTESEFKRPESQPDCKELKDEEQYKTTRSALPDNLLTEVSKSVSLLAEVKWDVQHCDTLLDVGGVLFPVEENFVSGVSDLFQSLFQSSDYKQTEDTCIFKLTGFDTLEIETVLKHIYSVNTEPITDTNVASLLQLGCAFGIKHLIRQCENYLMESETFNPFIMSCLAKQYGLTILLDQSYIKISKIDGIEERKEFQVLDVLSQNKILMYVIKRHKEAKKTLCQVDIHLCSHHGNQPKNSHCCFRAATYATEENRSFLVQMENPEKKLLQHYNDAYNFEL